MIYIRSCLFVFHLNTRFSLSTNNLLCSVHEHGHRRHIIEENI